MESHQTSQPVTQKIFNKNDSKAWADLAEKAYYNNQFVIAERYVRKAISLHENGAYFYSLSLILNAQERYDEAIGSIQIASILNPHEYAFKYTQGILLLNQQKFKRGWEYYRYRLFNKMPHNIFLNLIQNFTSLPEKLEHEKIFIINEQDLGDELFFARFTVLLKAKGAYLSYNPHNKLKGILQRTQIFDQLVEKVDATKQYHISSPDLPFFLKIHHPDQIPPPLELTPLPRLVKHYQKRLQRFAQLPCIGIIWRGGQKRKKDIDVKLLAQSLHGIKANFIILQRFPQQEEIKTFINTVQQPVYNFAYLNRNLEHVLAMLSLLDSLITVSTLNVYLRLSTGKDAHVLCNYPYNFRWGNKSKQTPWFKKALLYHQKPDKSWDSALQELKNDLSFSSYLKNSDL